VTAAATAIAALSIALALATIASAWADLRGAKQPPAPSKPWRVLFDGQVPADIVEVLAITSLDQYTRDDDRRDTVDAVLRRHIRNDRASDP
jgi:hypothetical protein